MALSKIFGGLFGGGPSGEEGSEQKVVGEPVTYEGYKIEAMPRKDGSQWQLYGRISKGEGDSLQVHELIRADYFSGLDEAVSFTVRKAQQVIDEQGDKIFRK